MRRHLVLLLVLMACAGAAQADIRYVPSGYPTIQAAVDASHAGDVVLIAPGIYNDLTHQAGPGDTTLCVVVMKSGITLQGSGAGVTIIDARRPSGHAGRGIQCTGITNATIQDLTVRNAFAQIMGSGIYCKQGSSPVIKNVEVKNCGDGGIIIGRQSPAQIQNCWIRNCLAKEGGGLAIYDTSNVIVTDCWITGNGAPSGGGVYARNCAPQFRNCIVDANLINQVNGAGGGFAFSNAQPTLTNCSITNNDSDGGGGGIYSSESQLTISNCLIQGNQTLGSNGPGGGILVDFQSSGLIEDCTITGNTVMGDWADGGGIAIQMSDPITIRQCTISANATEWNLAGGLWFWMTSPTVDKCIISHNNPGAAMVCNDASAVPVVSCTDLFGNQGGNTICGTNAGHNFSLDPRFCNLGGNDFRLQSNSPCAPGNHPDGPTACNGSRLGGEPLGCNPADVEEIPSGAVRLLANQPNPFGASTSIRFELPASGRALVQVFDVAGRQVRTLLDGPVSAGRQEVRWDGLDSRGERLANGLYFCRLSSGGEVRTRPMVLAR